MAAEEDTWSVDYPTSSSGIPVFDGRFGAMYFPDFSTTVCLDLKHVQDSGKSKIVAAVSCEDDPLLALNRNSLAIGSHSGITVTDISLAPTETVPVLARLELSGRTVPRGRRISALDWTGTGISRILAAGTTAGSIQLWDMRSPSAVLACNSPPCIPLPVSFLKWNRVIDSSLCSVQGDAVCVWDCRSLRSPVSQITSPVWKSVITGVDWVGSSDIILSTKSEGLVRFSDLAVEFLTSPSSSKNVGPLCAVPSDSFPGLVAYESEPGRIELVDPFSNTLIDSFTTGIKASSIGYIEDSRSLVVGGVESLVVRSIARNASGWTAKDSSSLLQSESSPRLHPVASHVTSSDQFLSDEMRALHAALSLAARRLRRLFIEASVDLDQDCCNLEVTVAGDRLRLKLLLRAQDCGNADSLTLSWEVWWATSNNENPDDSFTDSTNIADLPGIKTIESNYLARINLDQLVTEGDISGLVGVMRELKLFVSQSETHARREDSMVDDSPTEAGNIPFPHTCGICWSPSGDLFRFNSLRNLHPFPKHRERLTMNHFMELTDKISAQQGMGSGTGSSIVISLNEFWPYVEPSSVDNDDMLDEEFNQRTFTDACVQKVPATVFESNVEDHWFASMAPIVDFSKSPKETAMKLAEFAKHSFSKSNGANLVYDSICLLIELLPSLTAERSVLDLVKQAIILDRLRALYASEQTQAVAVISTLLILSDDKIRESDSEFFNAVLVLIHDHAVLFQRLGCPVTSRVLEKIQARFAPDLPLLFGDVLIGQKTKTALPLCSVCDLPVHGLGRYCPDCGHGGHLSHVLKRTVCAVRDCDCRCGSPSTPQTPPLRVQTSSIVSTFITS